MGRVYFVNRINRTEDYGDVHTLEGWFLSREEAEEFVEAHYNGYKDYYIEEDEIERCLDILHGMGYQKEKDEEVKITSDDWKELKRYINKSIVTLGELNKKSVNQYSYKARRSGFIDVIAKMHKIERR